MKLRIKTEVNTATGCKRYVVQRRGWFGWRDCRVEIGWGCDERAVFFTTRDAEAFLKEEASLYAWEPEWRSEP